MRIGNLQFGFINDKKVEIREVVLNPALEAYGDFESISQILAKIQGGLESVNVYENKGNGLLGLKEAEVQRFIRENAFLIYLREMVEGQAFIGVTKNTCLFVTKDETKYCVSSTLFKDKGLTLNTLVRKAIEHYEKTLNADNEVLTRSGFEGIVTPQTNTIDGGFVDDDSVNLLTDKLNNYGLQGQRKYLVTNQPYQLVQPKNELATLDFTTKQKQTFLTLCDKFGCPKELFAVADNSTYENRRLAKVDFYQNTIFPYLEKIILQINRINEDITGVSDVFYIAKNEVPEVAYEERNAKIAARQGVDALVKLYEQGIVTLEEVRKNISDYFYLDNEKI